MIFDVTVWSDKQMHASQIMLDTYNNVHVLHDSANTVSQPELMVHLRDHLLTYNPPPSLSLQTHDPNLTDNITIAAKEMI